MGLPLNGSLPDCLVVLHGNDTLPAAETNVYPLSDHLWINLTNCDTDHILSLAARTTLKARVIEGFVALTEALGEGVTPGALLGKAVREVRLNQGISLSGLAAKAATSTSYLSRLENGKIGSPTALMISKLGKALNLSESDLLRAALGEGADGLTWSERSFLVRFVEAPPAVRQAIMQLSNAMFSVLEEFNDAPTYDREGTPSWDKLVEAASEMVVARPNILAGTIQRRLNVGAREAELLLRIARKRLFRGKSA